MKLLISIFSLLFIVSCGGSSNNDNEPDPTSISSYTWELVSYQEQGESLKHVMILSSFGIEFNPDSGELGGWFDCNSLVGNFTISDETVEISGLSSTEIACRLGQVAGYNDQFQAIQSGLVLAEQYRIENDTLFIEASNGTELIFKPQFELCSDPVDIAFSAEQYVNRYIVIFDDEQALLDSNVPELLLTSEDAGETTYFDFTPGLVTETSDRLFNIIRCEEGIATIEFDSLVAAP